MIKTISLTANQETAVKIEGGSYCLIENRGTSVVYASKFPNVVASEDNVIAIDSASAKILENATKLSDSGVMQGTIYLVTDSDGAVEVRTAMTTDPFKSKQKGGGESSGGGVTDTYSKAVIDAKLSKKADEDVVNQALDNKVDKDGNKVLSDNNFSNDEKEKLANLVNYDDTQVKTDIINLQTSKANADEVYTIAQTNSAIATEVAKIVADAPESLDTLQEISTWIETHEDSASAMNLQIQTNKTNISKKVDKKDGYSLVSDTEITRLAEVKNYDDTQIKNDIALNTSSLGMSRKNLLNPKTVEISPANVTRITFTTNGDGTISASGTATANAFYKIKNMKFEAGKSYILNGCPIGGSSSTYFMAIDGMPTSQFDTGKGSAVYIPDSDVTKTIIICINAGITVTSDTCIFKPMIRYVDITDNTYEPYTPSLQEQINDILARLMALEG